MSVRVRAIRTLPSFAFHRALPAAVLSTVAAFVASPALAQEAATAASKNALGLKVGALGLGLEYTRSLGERLTVRAAAYGSQYGFDSEESDIEYAMDLIWDSFALGVDLHPGKGPFRLSLGYLSNDNRLEAQAAPTQIEVIGDTPYTPQQIGNLYGDIAFDDDGAAYAGLGWDWSRNKTKFGMSLDLGLVSQGSPVVELRATGTAVNTPAFQSDLEAEEAQIEEDLDDLDIVPYITLGFNFRF